MAEISLGVIRVQNDGKFPKKIGINDLLQWVREKLEKRFFKFGNLPNY